MDDGMHLSELRPYLDSGHTLDMFVTSIKFYRIRKVGSLYELTRRFTTAPNATCTWYYPKWAELYNDQRHNRELADDNWELL
jgi:hypothetical protein